MQVGSETMYGKKQFLVVNEQGFGSVYALLILQVILVFSLTLLTSAKQQAAYLQLDQQLQEAQLLVLYYVKDVLHNEMLTNDEVIDEHQAPTTPLILTKTLYYKNKEITITLEDTQAVVALEECQLQIIYDKARKCILNLVYF